MTDLILDRRFAAPLTVQCIYDMARSTDWCFDAHRIGWHSSFLLAGGTRLVCWLYGPDVESARNALRLAGEDVRAVAKVSVHDAEGLGEGDFAAANVLVERSFPRPVRLADIQAIEDAGAGCLEAHDVKFLRTYFTADHKRMYCLYRAPDAESVRLAQRQARMPLDGVFSFTRVDPPA
jgi:hypothetical protein